jgi:hypothetical protein
MFEEEYGLTSIPVNFVGLALCTLFWFGVYLVCLAISAVVGGAPYRALTPKQRKYWDNYSWSIVHGVIAFTVRLPAPCAPLAPSAVSVAAT